MCIGPQNAILYFTLSFASLLFQLGAGSPLNDFTSALISLALIHFVWGGRCGPQHIELKTTAWILAFVEIAPDNRLVGHPVDQRCACAH